MIESVDDDPLADFFDIFRELRSLIKILPKDVKDKMTINMEKIIELTDDDKKLIESRIGQAPILLLGGVPFSEEEWKRRQERNRIISNIFKERMEDVIGEVAMLLHEKLKVEVSKSEIK